MVSETTTTGFCGYAVEIPRDAFYLTTDIMSDVCMHSDLLHDYKPLNSPQTFTHSSGKQGIIKGRGTLKLSVTKDQVIKVLNVAYVPEWERNVLNPLHIEGCESGTFYEHGGQVIHRRFGMIAYEECRKYRLSLKVIPPMCPSRDSDAVYFSTTAREKCCRDWTLPHDYKPYAKPQRVGTLAGGSSTKVGTGTLKITDGSTIFTFTDVVYVPDAYINFINPNSFLLDYTDSLSTTTDGIRHSRFGMIGVHEGYPRWLLRSTLRVIRPVNRAN
ncbi:uncharacterized protein J8A68_002356 [[Candida] subhashii]|uniref:Retrovirus-related Pol polyprotein from transposon TNT 1-94-like beta-barrel domain-containing protein n=1 Tax=[Candida] subhashii TaxID=561895 RepID=A0A8J5QRR9_9ASCO|nr:uncharacterized protein J8A68_002356 [[Candida] subhashii]KAG7664102.1 hypothetical protein J8A68_002356 [[Candida] subhashii]